MSAKFLKLASIFKRNGRNNGNNGTEALIQKSKIGFI
jgi:hypothetical protein